MLLIPVTTASVEEDVALIYLPGQLRGSSSHVSSWSWVAKKSWSFPGLEEGALGGNKFTLPEHEGATVT